MMVAQKRMLNTLEGTDFEKRLGVVEFLLNYGAQVNAKAKAQETPLHLAVKSNCFEIAQLLVEYEANVDEVDKDRRTPLQLCAEFGDLKMAELLLKGCEIRPTAIGKMCDLDKGVTIQELHLVKLLLKCCRKQADEMRAALINISKRHLQYDGLFDEQSQRDVSCRCFSFLESVYNILINKSGLTDWEEFWTSYQNYQKAPCRCHRENAKFILLELEHTIDSCIGELIKHAIEQVSEMTMFENGATPLHLAVGLCCRSPNFNDFQLQLADAMRLNNNDKTTITDFKDETDQTSAKENMLIEFFTLLLDHADECNLNSMRPFDHNSYNERNQSKTLQITGNLKSFVNRKDSEGYDALLKAVEFNQTDVVQLLLNNGADTCSITSQGCAALHIAVNSIHRVLKSSNPVEMIEVLLTSGKFSVNALTFKSETPLHLAISNCGCGLSGQESEDFQRRRRIQNSIISLLLENKANVNQQDCEGLTPLMIASERGCYHIVKRLLNWNFVKVDLDARDKYGETALIKAARMHHIEIVEALVKSVARVDLQDYRGFTALHAALHDPDEFTSLFEFLETACKGSCSSNNELNEKVLIIIKNRLTGKRDGKKPYEKALIKIFMLRGLQFEISDFANRTAFDFLVESEIQSSRSRKEAQQRLDKMRNGNNRFKETPCHLDVRWLQIKRRRKSPLYWLAAVCVMIAEHKVIPATQARKIKKIQDYKGRTVLHYAANLTAYVKPDDRSSVFKALLNSGCQIDARDVYQRTPLHYLDASSRNLLLGEARLIGTESTGKQRVISRELLEIKDTDDKTVDELSRMRKGNAERERMRRSRIREAVKAEYLGAIRYDNGIMPIEQNTCNIETQFPWITWNEGFAQFAYRNSLTQTLNVEIGPHNFMHRLCEALGRKDPWFACQPLLVGSAFEKTKIDSPDEFDFDLILTKVSNTVEVIPSPLAPEGFVRLRRKSNVPLGETDKRFFDEEGFLKTNEINCRFQIILRQVLQDPSFWENEYLFESTDAEDKMKRFVRRHDRYRNGRDHNDLADQRINPGICTTIKLKPTRALDGEYLPNDISLDLVPCIHVDGWWPDKARSDISDTLKAKGCNLVFDQPQRKYPWVPFGENYARISFAPAESQLSDRVRL